MREPPTAVAPRVLVPVQAVEHRDPALGVVLAQLAHVDTGAGTVGIAVDREIDDCVQDHELEELEVRDPLLDVAPEVVGAHHLAGAPGQLDHHGRGRQEQVVELGEGAATHDVGVGVLQTTDRDVGIRLFGALPHRNIFTIHGESHQPGEVVSDEEASLGAWTEHTVHGRVVDVRRLPRWRPAWDIDIDIDGHALPLHARGEREPRIVMPYRIADGSSPTTCSRRTACPCRTHTASATTPTRS